MIIVEKNVGPKIDYEIKDTATRKKITFEDDRMDLTVNLAAWEQDDPVHIDVCHDEGGNLIIGTNYGWAYVAQLDIPARQYEEVPVEGGEEGETERRPLPLDLDTVTLTLWALV